MMSPGPGILPFFQQLICLWSTSLQLFPPCTLKTLLRCIKNCSTPSVSTQPAAFPTRPSMNPGSPLRTFPSFCSSQGKDGDARCTSRLPGSGGGIILLPNCLLCLLPPPLRSAPFSFIAPNLLNHSRLPIRGHFHALTVRLSSPLPKACHHPSRPYIPKETLHTLRLFISWPPISVAFTSAPWRTGFPCPHPWPSHHLQTVLPMKSHTQISHYLLPPSSQFLTLTKPPAFPYEALSHRDCSAVSFSPLLPLLLLTFVLVLLKMNL